VVFSAVHELAEVTFSWYNFDSPFYGDTGVEVSGFPVAPQKKRMYFGLPSDYSNLSESDKEKFVSDFAKQFFPGIEGIEKDIAEIADSEKIVEIPWDPFAES
jgi:hypothetical protein